MSDLLKRLARMLRHWHPPGPGPDQDPYAPVREPRRGGPRGSASRVAVREPDPDTTTVQAVSGRRF